MGATWNLTAVFTAQHPPKHGGFDLSEQTKQSVTKFMNNVTIPCDVEEVLATMVTSERIICCSE